MRLKTTWSTFQSCYHVLVWFWHYKFLANHALICVRLHVPAILGVVAYFSGDRWLLTELNSSFVTYSYYTCKEKYPKLTFTFAQADSVSWLCDQLTLL